MILTKARRKAEEARFFVSAVRQAGDVDAAEFSFSALLGSGKSVRYAVHAQVFAIERTRFVDDVARKRSKTIVEALVKKKQFSVGKPRPTTKTAEEYVRLLEAFINYRESEMRDAV